MVENNSNDFRLNYAAFLKMEVIRITGSSKSALIIPRRICFKADYAFS